MTALDVDPLTAPTTAPTTLPTAAPPVPSERPVRPRWLNRARPEWVFLVVAGVMGTLLSFLTPPIQVPDENAHLFRAYQVSTGVLVAPNMSADAPVSLIQLMQQFSRLPGQVNEKTTVDELRRAMGHRLMPRETAPFPLPSTAIYSPVPYAGQAIGMAVARRMERSPITVLYAGRVGNALVYTLLGWLAIRLMPVLKWPACILLAAPLQLMLAGSLSEDPTTLAIVFLAIAIILRIACAPGTAGLGIKVGLLIVLVAVGLCKSVYSPVVLLLLAVPAARWGTGWRRWAWPTAAVLAVAAAVGTWSTLASPMNVRQRSGDPRIQLHWVEYHPGSFLGDLWRALKLEADVLAVDGIGRLGWGEYALSVHVLDAMFVGLIWMSVQDDSTEGLPAAARPVALGVATLFTLAIAVSVFVLWHVKGENIVVGLQGRYFIPVMLLGCVAIRRRGSVGLRPATMVVSLGLLCAYTIWVIVGRYYLA